MASGWTKCWRFQLNNWFLHYLVRIHGNHFCRTAYDGCPRMLLAYFASSLGRVLEQVLQGYRLPLHPLLVLVRVRQGDEQIMMFRKIILINL